MWSKLDIARWDLSLGIGLTNRQVEIGGLG